MTQITSLEVTWLDIAMGADDRWRCPVALAAAREFGLDPGEAQFGDDGWGEWELEVYGRRYRVVGGPRFALAFDSGEDVRPGRFVLERLEDEDDDA